MPEPYAPPPTQTPEPVPPNRRPGASPTKTLALWMVLIALFVGFYRLFSAAPSGAPAPQEEPSPSSPAEPWPLALPLAAYLATAVGLVSLRRRLPASYRTFELREIPTQKTDVQPVANPSPISLDLTGTDLQRPVRLRIDGAGLHWRAEKRLLQPAQELEVAWEELESIATGRQQSGAVTWGFVLGLIGAFQLTTDWRIAAGGIAVGASVALVGWKRTRGLLSFATSTHTLTFSSKELGTAEQDALMAAARERRPQAVRAPTRSGCLTALYWLVLDPFAQLAHLVRSDRTLHAMLLREGANFPDEDTATAAVVQRRLFAVWTGGLRAVGPLSCALAGALATRESSVGAAAGVASSVVGLILVARTTHWFARFSGMSVVRPAPAT